MKLIIGSHVSFLKEKQLIGCVEEALSYGSNTFMFYTGAPQNTNRIAINDNITETALKMMKENNIDSQNIVVHAPYIINLANPTDERAYNFAIAFLKQELDRCEALKITKLVLHPGNHTGIGEEAGIKNIIKALDIIMAQYDNINICIESMAGKGSECGYNFEQLRQIVDGVKKNKQIQVCLDTCHMHDAGYDLTDFNKVLDDFDKIVGLNKLACIHINDSKNTRGSKKDRHENIGLGYIGFDTLLNIIYNPRLENIPKILETPYVTESFSSDKKIYPPYKFEIEMIKSKEFNKNILEDIRNYYKKTN